MSALSEPKFAAKTDANIEARCKKEVMQYLDALQFVRQSAGESISAKVVGKYVQEDQLTMKINSTGYCSAAQLLRDKYAAR